MIRAPPLLFVSYNPNLTGSSGLEVVCPSVEDAWNRLRHGNVVIA